LTSKSSQYLSWFLLFEGDKRILQKNKQLT